MAYYIPYRCDAVLNDAMGPRRMLLWSSVTPGSSNYGGYGYVRFIPHRRRFFLMCTEEHDDPSTSVACCAGAAPTSRDMVDVNIGHRQPVRLEIIDVTGSDARKYLMVGGSHLTKSGQNLMVDSGDCVDDVQIRSLQCCSNQAEIHAAAVKPFVSGRTALSSDAGSKLSETPSLMLNTLASEPGSSDFRALVIADIGYVERTFAVESRRRYDLKKANENRQGTTWIVASRSFLFP